jgi:PAS domain S-box-containing protein
MDDNSEKLRAQAKEELRQGKRINTSLYETDLKVLVEELAIYQIELEHQNQELILSQEQLQHSNDRYVDLFDNAPIGYMIVDISGVIKDINQTAAKLLERSKNEFVDTKITKFIHPDYQDIYYHYFHSLTNQRHLQPCDIKLRKANNSFFYGRIQGVCQTEKLDHEAEFRLAISDISIQKEMEIKLLAAKALTEQSEERFQLLFNKAPLGYQSLDINGNFIEVNQQWLDTLGYERDEVIGKWFGDFLTPMYQNGFRERFPIFKAQGHIHSEFEMLHKNNSILYIAFDGKIGNDSDGNFKQTHCILQDVTESRRISEALKKSDEQHRIVLQTAIDGFWILNLEGKFIEVNDAYCNMSGYTETELLNMCISDVEVLENKTSTEIHINKVIETGSDRFVTKHKRKDGSVYDVEISAVYQIEYKDVFVVFVRDVTERKKTEKALKQSEERYALVMDASEQGIWDWNVETNEVFYSQQWKKQIGYNDDELKNDFATWIEHLHPEEAEYCQTAVISYLKEPVAHFVLEFRFRHKDGTYRWIHNKAASLKNKDGKVIRMFGSHTDITERKQAEDALRESEELFSLFMKFSPVYTFIKEVSSTQSRVLVSSDNYADMTGIPNSEMKGKTMEELFPAKFAAKITQDDFAVITKGEVLQIDEELNNCSYTTIKFPIVRNGKTLLAGFTIDITERKRAEVKLRASEENLSITLHSIGDGVISTDINGLVVNMNPIAERLCGWELTDALGKPLPEVFKIINAETRQIVTDPVEKVFEHGEIVGLANHTVLISKNGTEFQIADSAAPIKNKNGEITGVVLVFSDVSDKYAAELALKESEERFKALHNASFGGISIHDKGKILECNQGLVEMTGYSMEELIGMDGLLLIAPEHREIVLNNIVTGYEKPYEANGLRKNGELFPMRLEARNVPYKGKSVRTVEFRDITENKLAEEALKRTKEKITEERKMLRILIDNLPDHIYIKDLEGRKVISNLADFKDLGLASEEQILGKTDLELFPGESGQRGYADDMEVITTGKAIMWQEEDFVNSSGTRRWSITSKIPLYDSAGKIIGLVGIGHDITKRKKTEEELIEAKEKALESDRLKSAFLANMSHEIRTPMNGILGFAELLKEPDLTGEQQQEYIDIIGKSGNRMLNIINDIVDISKIEAGLMKLDIQQTNINEQIEYIYTFFKPEVEAKGMKLFFRNSLPAREAILTTDREKIYAILTNLVKNAIKYTNHGSIEFGYDPVAETGHGLSLQFYVKDTGIGIPKERQEAIFERFIQADITDKMAHQGAGLGLSITKAYVEMLGGEIWVESEVGIGSAFYFNLPYYAKPVKETLDQQFGSSVKIDAISKLKILIAEDDDVSEMLISINVNEFGKEILRARTGTEALESCRQNPDIDLVLMDIRMPEMGGYEATRLIREFNKDVVIIAQTAYGLSSDREKAIEAGCNNYISKPINKEELRVLIKKYFR